MSSTILVVEDEPEMQQLIAVNLQQAGYRALRAANVPAAETLMREVRPNMVLGDIEFRMLHFFMTHAERVYSRAQLLDEVWGDRVFVEERTVDVHIRRLRQALAPTGHDRLIETVRGTGYRFRRNPG